jgi:hypothetical protein
MKLAAILLTAALFTVGFTTTSCSVSPDRAEAIRVGISTLGPILERRGVLSPQDLQDIKDGAAVLIVEKDEVETLPNIEVTASK